MSLADEVDRPITVDYLLMATRISHDAEGTVVHNPGIHEFLVDAFPALLSIAFAYRLCVPWQHANQATSMECAIVDERGMNPLAVLLPTGMAIPRIGASGMLSHATAANPYEDQYLKSECMTTWHFPVEGQYGIQLFHNDVLLRTTHFWVRAKS